MMLRRDTKATFEPEWLGLRWRFVSGSRRASGTLSRGHYEESLIVQKDEPVRVLTEGSKTWWWHCDQFFSEGEGLEQEEVQALVHEREDKKRRRLDNARSRMLQGPPQSNVTPRESLTRDAKLRIWGKDGGRCRNCGSDQLLQFDHIIPLAMGGSNSEHNFQLLCDVCNREKGGGLLEPNVKGAPLESPDPRESFPPPSIPTPAQTAGQTHDREKHVAANPKMDLFEEAVGLETELADAVTARREQLTESLDTQSGREDRYEALIVITNLMAQEHDLKMGWADRAAEAMADYEPGNDDDRIQAAHELVEFLTSWIQEFGPSFESLKEERDALSDALDPEDRARTRDRASSTWEQERDRIVKPLIARVQDLQAESR